MAVAEIELRVAALEAEVARLRQKLEKPDETKSHWVDEVYGAFAGDPDFLEAMRLGRKYRESLRPKTKKRKMKSASERDAKQSAGAAKGAKKPTVKRAAKSSARRTVRSRKP
ncbi:MAG: hypothetical protein L0220_03225 [Acidobacteria bacterium]|nr:hypothetical protein [Acidobacteriota bacterium]